MCVLSGYSRKFNGMMNRTGQCGVISSIGIVSKYIEDCWDPIDIPTVQEIMKIYEKMLDGWICTDGTIASDDDILYVSVVFAAVLTTVI